MILVRIFRTRHQAEAAKSILEQAGIYSATISEDKFEGVSIQKYGVPARFRLNVGDNSDLQKAAKFLAKKINNR